MGWGNGVLLTIRAHAFDASLANYYQRWFNGLFSSQDDDGLFPALYPIPEDYERPGPASGYSDAAIVVPYALWQMTGDDSLARKSFEDLVEFSKARREVDPEFDGGSFDHELGDYGNKGESTPSDYLALCYFALDCHLLSEMGSLVGHLPYIMQHTAWFSNLRKGFEKRYLTEKGRLTVKTQTARILALRVGLLSGDSRTSEVAALVEDLQKNGVRCGVLGQGLLLPILSVSGHQDLALKIAREWATDDDLPATTSAAASEWLLGFMGGINHRSPGFQAIRIAPAIPKDPKSGPTWVKAHHDSPYGRISVSWKRVDKKKLTLEVTTPGNTNTVVAIPASKQAKVTESGKAAESEDVTGLKFMKHANGRKEFILQSGTYQFEVTEP